MVATVIINLPLPASIAFHNIFHGFQAGRGTGTASPVTKLVHQLTSMREEFLYAIFLDLHKAYDALDRNICLDILEGYVMGPQDRLILCAYWDRLWMVDITGEYYGAAFQGFRRVNKGELLSPTTFNVVVDEVVCHWISYVERSLGGQDGWGR